LRRAAAGRAADLEALYEANVDGLYAFVFYRVGRDPALAEDAVQETFTVALDRIDDYSPERGSLGSWLCTLSRNVCRDLVRGHRRSHELSEAWQRIDESLGQIFTALAEEPLSDELIDREETRDLVNMTIANLPESYRTALERKYVCGDSMHELAGALGLSETATKSLLARARRAFRETFVTVCQTMAEVS
jgi:RNA polymerase sigma-70 factor (ECF subfamily)